MTQMTTAWIMRRAFELARSGGCRGLADIEEVLLGEGCDRSRVAAALGPPDMRRALRAACRTIVARAVPRRSVPSPLG